MLESLEIKKSYQASRQELANALYREDAATRVIARLLKERDEARRFVFHLLRSHAASMLMRSALSSIQSTIGLAPAPQAEEAAEDVDMRPEGSLPQDVESVVMETNNA